MPTIPTEILIDERLRQGALWLEDGELRLKLPTSARWLFDEVLRRRAEAVTECMNRWMHPGISYEEWCERGLIQ